MLVLYKKQALFIKHQVSKFINWVIFISLLLLIVPNGLIFSTSLSWFMNKIGKKKKKKPFNFSKFVIKENSFEENYLFLLIFCFSMWISFSILLQNNNNVREFWSLGWCLRRNCFGHWLQLKHSLSIPLFFNTSLHFICMIYLNPTNLWTWSFSYCTYYLPSITCTWI